MRRTLMARVRWCIVINLLVVFMMLTLHMVNGNVCLDHVRMALSSGDFILSSSPPALNNLSVSFLFPTCLDAGYTIDLVLFAMSATPKPVLRQPFEFNESKVGTIKSMPLLTNQHVRRLITSKTEFLQLYLHVYASFDSEDKTFVVADVELDMSQIELRVAALDHASTHPTDRTKNIYQLTLSVTETVDKMIKEFAYDHYVISLESVPNQSSSIQPITNVPVKNGLAVISNLIVTQTLNTNVAIKVILLNTMYEKDRKSFTVDLLTPTSSIVTDLSDVTLDLTQNELVRVNESFDLIVRLLQRGLRFDTSNITIALVSTLDCTVHPVGNTTSHTESSLYIMRNLVVTEASEFKPCTFTFLISQGQTIKSVTTALAMQMHGSTPTPTLLLNRTTVTSEVPSDLTVTAMRDGNVYAEPDVVVEIDSKECTIQNQPAKVLLGTNTGKAVFRNVIVTAADSNQRTCTLFVSLTRNGRTILEDSFLITFSVFNLNLRASTGSIEAGVPTDLTLDVLKDGVPLTEKGYTVQLNTGTSGSEVCTFCDESGAKVSVAEVLTTGTVTFPRVTFMITDGTIPANAPRVACALHMKLLSPNQVSTLVERVLLVTLEMPSSKNGAGGLLGSSTSSIGKHRKSLAIGLGVFIGLVAVVLFALFLYCAIQRYYQSRRLTFVPALWSSEDFNATDEQFVHDAAFHNDVVPGIWMSSDPMPLSAVPGVISERTSL